MLSPHQVDEVHPPSNESYQGELISLEEKRIFQYACIASKAGENGLGGDLDTVATVGQLYSYAAHFTDGLTWSNISALLSDCVRRIDRAVGHVFNALAMGINNANILGAGLQGAQYVCFTASYLQTGAFVGSERVGQAIMLISMTRFFSDLCYLFSLEFLSDLKEGRYGFVLGQIACAVSNCIKSLQAFLRMIQDCEINFPGFSVGDKPLLSRIAEGFVVCGLLGHIVDALQRIVAHSACNPQDWCDLVAALTAIGLPLAVLMGGAPALPILILGIVSCLARVLSGVFSYFVGEPQEKLPGDFAEHTKDLAKFFSTATSCLTVFRAFLGDQGMASFREFSVAVKSFSAIRKGLEIIHRFKEWLSVDQDGCRFWEKRSIWKVSSKIFLAGETLLDFRSFLMTFEFIKKETFLNWHWGGIPFFSVLDTAFSLGATISSIIDNLLKWIKELPKHTRLVFKKSQWELLVEGLVGVGSFSQAESFRQMQAELLHKYESKTQRELLRGAAHDPLKVARWQRHILNMSTGQIAAYLEDKRQQHLQRIQEIHANTQISEWREAFQVEIDAFQQLSPLDFAKYRKALALNRYNNSSAEMAKIGWDIISKTFKGVLAVAALGLEFLPVSAFVKTIPKFLSMLNKIASFCFDIFVSCYFKRGEETLSFSAEPTPSLSFRALYHPLRYVPTP